MPEKRERSHMANMVRIKSLYGLAANTKSKDVLRRVLRHHMPGGVHIITVATRIHEMLGDNRRVDRDKLDAAMCSLSTAKDKGYGIICLWDEITECLERAQQALHDVQEMRQYPDPLLRELQSKISAAMEEIEQSLGHLYCANPEPMLAQRPAKPPLAATHSNIFLDSPQGNKPKNGAPPKPNRVDWPGIDWTQSSNTIADAENVSVQIVNRMRHKYAPETVRPRKNKGQ